MLLYAVPFLKSVLSDLHKHMRFYALLQELFASSKDLSVSGKGFKISRIKYLAPILYDADKSQLYLFPV